MNTREKDFMNAQDLLDTALVNWLEKGDLIGFSEEDLAVRLEELCQSIDFQVIIET